MRFALLPAFALLCLSAFAEPIVIVSGKGWRASTTEEAGWSAEAFDDSKWEEPEKVTTPDADRDMFMVDNCFGFDSEAGWLRLGSDSDCWFRGTFEVPAGFKRAEMLYCIDDLGELWINGELADNGRTLQFGYRGSAVVLDLLPWVREGKNTIAAHAHNIGGPMGFSSEVRIDGEDFLPPGPGEGNPLDAEVADAVKEFAKRLDAESTSIRDAAEAALIVLVRQEGNAVVPLILESVAGLSVEARSRATRIRNAQFGPFWEPTEWEDIRWAFKKMTGEEIAETLSGDPTVQWSLLRVFIAARTEAASDPAGLLKIAIKLAEDADEERSERGIRLIEGIRLAPALGAVRKVLRDRPATRAGSFAAATIARLGTQEDIAALEIAAKCGAKPTERAAATAIRILKK